MAMLDDAESDGSLRYGGGSVVKRSGADSDTDDSELIYMKDARDLIGGSSVVSEAHDQYIKRTSVYEEDKSSSSINEEEDMQDNENPLSHKIFTFSLPLGGTTLRPLSKIKTLLPSPDSLLEGDDKLQRHQIKEKLKRQESISSIEELLLFKNEKGVDNVRRLAFEKAFELSSLKHAIKEITTDPNKLTHDGYQYGRLDTIYDELEGDIVILGGYRGSILRDTRTRKRIWIPIKAGLNLRKIDLLLGPRDEDELQSEKTIVSDGMLTHIGPVDVSKVLIRKLKSNPKVHVEDFGYDWRLSLDITTLKLRDRLQKLYDRQTNKKGVYVIAHSMGGLLAHKVLQDYTHLIRGIIYVGAPSQCPNILGPLRFGDEVLLNRSILSKEATFFMRSSYYFLPFDGRCFVSKDHKRKYDLDFFDPKVWIDLGLSPLVNKKRLLLPNIKSRASSSSLRSLNTYIDSSQKLIKNLNPLTIIKSVATPNSAENTLEDERIEDEDFKTPYEDCVEYLTRILQRTKKFLESLEYDSSKNYPPLAMVYSHEIPTVRGAKVNGLDDIRNARYDDFYYGPGDGVVHHRWLLPEQRGFPVVAKIASSAAHISLVGDLESIAKAFISIVDSEREKSH